MRFLFCPLSVTGHLSPALPLMRELADRGHDVRCYTGSRFRPAVEASGARHIPFRSAPEIEWERLNELFPERPQRAGLAQLRWDLKTLLIDEGGRQCSELLGVVEQGVPDAIVSDAMGVGGLLAAEKLGLPAAVLCPLNLFVPSRDTAPDGFGLPPSATPLGRLRNRILNWLVFRVVLRDVTRHLHELCSVLGLPRSSATLFDMPLVKSQLFLQPTAPSFEYPRSDLPGHVHFIGGLLPPVPDDYEPPSWWAELEEERPVVLVTQGTVATDFDDLLIPAIRGLAEEDILVVATTGNRDLIGLERPLNLRLEPFLPFGRIMPFVDLMITNGGYGGVHFALAHGVPLLVAGQTEDKREICARVAWSGVGIDLKTSRATPEGILRGARTVLRESKYRERAEALSAELQSLGGVARGADLLERLATTGQPVVD